MKLKTKQKITDSLRDFRLPRYEELPDVGLYLEQTAKYISEFLSPLEEGSLTPSMVSNYVKKGLIRNPVKKQYGREQIAYLFFIAVAKSVLSLDALTGFIQLQQRTYSLPKAYDYFCDEFENLLQFTFEVKDTMEVSGEGDAADAARVANAVQAELENRFAGTAPNIEAIKFLLTNRDPQNWKNRIDTTQMGSIATDLTITMKGEKEVTFPSKESEIDLNRQPVEEGNKAE